MPKASFKLSNGTEVTVEGSQEDVQRLLDYYAGREARPGSYAKDSASVKAPAQPQDTPRQQTNGESTTALAKIVGLVKTCGEAEAIETEILDKRSQIDRTLLPLYIVYAFMDNASGLTTGDIKLITTDLGIPISVANASHVLAGPASRYVIGDRVRTKGQPVRYKLSRRGAAYVKSVLQKK